MSYQEAFLFGIAGAIAAEFVYWARFQRTFHKEKPEHASSWFVCLGWIVIGGLVPCAYIKGTINVNFFFCIHAGASAPVFLNQFLKGKVEVQ